MWRRPAAALATVRSCSTRMSLAPHSLVLMSIDARASELLRRITGDPGATFRNGQLDAIRELVEERRRVLVVQRTGWGKSAVYFIATRLLRDEGAGASLLISPLLALMRNQIAAAARGGIRAATINSANLDDWDGVEQAAKAGELDLLLVSPERLNNPRFRADVLPALVRGVGMMIVDEAHCISDWGHDFRPDYRRVARILDVLPPGVPVLCTTATANQRVIEDIASQLGEGLSVVRGPLERESLQLSVVSLPQPADRLVWLSQVLPTLPGSGVVYCLTVNDTERVASWLKRKGIDALAYSGESDEAHRLAVEDALATNRVKVVVATSALGMGYDKPDLGFVVHFQSPGSPIAYYQQVGRAGRAIEHSVGVLLRGHEDADIQDYFIERAFPPREAAEAVLARLEAAEGRPVPTSSLLSEVNVGQSRLDGMLKVLEVEGAVDRHDAGWARTAEPWAYDDERVTRVTAARRAEQAAMRSYALTSTCLMAFLRAQLDDPDASPCGRCANCTRRPWAVTLDPLTVAEAVAYIRSAAIIVEPRKRWMGAVPGLGASIPKDRLLQPGRALAIEGDGGWGSVVRRLRADDEALPDELVAAVAGLVQGWGPIPAPEWVTAVPSTSAASLVRSLGRALAAALDLPYVATLRRTRSGAPQAHMLNTAQQVRNVLGAFEVAPGVEVPAGPVLLVDDLVASRWTLTVAGQALLAAGSGPVVPFTLAKSQGR